MAETSANAGLDLTDDELDTLLARAAELATREIRAVRDGPVFAEPPSAERIARLLDDSSNLPVDGESLDALLERCGALLAAGRRTAPTFFGYILSPASPVGVAADLLASAANQSVAAWRSSPAATQLELLTLRWLGRLVGFADDPSGVLVSGGSLANLTGLFIALRARTPVDADRRTLVAYASDESHFSIAKAAAILGITLRAVAIDASGRLDVDALADAVNADRAAGHHPFCVVATAGTTATGAVDPLDAVATVAADHGLWLHVDGAYGAPAAADPASRHLFAGIERADSLTIDAHKWLYVPVDCGALLVRDAEAGPAAFGSHAGTYLRLLAQEGVEAFAWWDQGIELTRRFRALKLWMTLRHYGVSRIAAAIGHDIEMAALMGRLVRASADLQLLTEPRLSICCFRHAPAWLPEETRDAHNEQLLAALHRDGRVYLSNATIDGRFALRACITNFRTTRDDIERTLSLVREIGDQLAHRPL